ncbi:FUSC family protein [Francisellaceae bacterium]|nr:FUSC family protein [Francisellaceae bacterium]
MHPGLKLSLESARVFQITILVCIGLAFYIFSNIPYSFWILNSIFATSGAYESGLVRKKAGQRGIGTVFGLIIAAILLQFLEFNPYITPFILLLVGAATFAIPGKFHVSQTIFLSMFIMFGFALTSVDVGHSELISDRLISTVLGVFIVLIGEYVLFTKFDYSRRNYAILQREVCLYMLRSVNSLIKLKGKPLSRPKRQKLREGFSGTFSKLANSSNSIMLDFHASDTISQHMKQFDSIIWEMRTEISAIHYCSVFHQDQKALEQHLEKFYQLLKEAKKNYIPKSLKSLK